MTQDALFDVSTTQAQVDRGQRGKARRGDRTTSVDAAASVGRGAEDAIKRLYHIPRALTDDEIAGMLPEWHPPTVKSARSRLSNDGYLTDGGQRRKSNRGRDQIVWIRK